MSSSEHSGRKSLEGSRDWERGKEVGSNIGIIDFPTVVPSGRVGLLSSLRGLSDKTHEPG